MHNSAINNSMKTNNIINFLEKRDDYLFQEIKQNKDFRNYLINLEEELEDLKNKNEIESYSIKVLDSNRVEILIDT